MNYGKIKADVMVFDRRKIGMKQDKIKLLSAAIMLSGLLSVSPAVAEDESSFPIVIDDGEKQTQADKAYSNQTNGVYKIVKSGSLVLAPTDETTDLEFANNKNVTGNGASIVVEQGGQLSVSGTTEKYYTFKNNSAKNGGAIYAELTNYGDSAAELFNVSNAKFESNSADKGGAVYVNFKHDNGYNNDVTATINNAVFNENKAVNGGAVYVDFAKDNKTIGANIIGSTFMGNMATENGGAVYGVAEGGESVNSSVSNSTFTQNTAAKNGGAIYTKTSTNVLAGTSVIENSTFTQNKALNGGAIASEAAESNAGALVTVSDSTFDSNEATNYGGAIFAPNGYVVVKDSDFVNNKATQGSAIYAADVKISASGKDVKISGNQGNAIYVTDGVLTMNAANGRTITVDDNVYVGSTDNAAAIAFAGSGNYVFNNKINFSSDYASGFAFVASGANVKLGKEAATGSYSVQQNASAATLDLQNENIDKITIPYLISNNANNTLTFKVDYNAIENEIDNVVINSNNFSLGEISKGGVKQNVKFDLDDVEIYDDENWIDKSVRTVRYLTDNSDSVNDTTVGGSYKSNDGVTYDFVVDTENKGQVKITRTEDMTTTLEQVVASDDTERTQYTIRRQDYQLADDSTEIGTLNAAKTEFTIDGQEKYALNGGKTDEDGNVTKRGGLTIENENQAVDILGVKEFKNFTTALTNKGELHIENTTFVNNDTDLVNSKNTDIINSTLSGKVQNTVDGTLLITNSSIKNTVTNDGTFVVWGDSSVSNIDGKGALTVGDDIVGSEETKLSFDNENGITQTSVTINHNGNVSVYADKLVTTKGVKNDGTLTLKAQTATEEAPETINNNEISGEGVTNITGGVIRTNKTISTSMSVDTDADLRVADAAYIGGIVTNNGTVTIEGGELGKYIIKGTNDNAVIKLSNDVTSKADYLGTKVTNNGNLTLNGGTLENNIDGDEAGKVYISTTNADDTVTVSDNVTINQDITLNQGNIKTTVAGIGKTLEVKNDGNVYLNGGKLAEGKITDGTNLGATLYINRDVVEFEFDNSDITESNILGNLVISDDATFKPFKGYKGTSNALKYAGDATLDLQNSEAQDVSLASLASDDEQDVLGLKLDYNDTFAKDKDDADYAANVKGTINIESLDLRNMPADAEDNYILTGAALKEKVTFRPDGVTFADNSTQNAVYYNRTDGKITLREYSNGLNGAIDDIELLNVDMAYRMKGAETVSSSTQSITKGDLTIFGQGNTVNGDTALTVGDSTTPVARQLRMIDVNLNNKDNNKYSLIVNDKAVAGIGAKDYDVTVAGNIKLEADDASTSSSEDKLVFAVADGKTITLNGDIKSDSLTNTVTFAGEGANSKIIANGDFDPFTADVDDVVLTRSANTYDDAITYNLGENGTLKYSNDNTLYSAAHHTDATLNSINFQGGTLNLANGAANDIRLKSLVLGIDNADPTLQEAKTSYINVDVDLANKKMDTLNADTVKVVGDSKLNLDMNVISDATSEVTEGIKFTDNDDLWNAVAIDDNKEYAVESSIYKYTVKKGGTSASDGFTFNRTGGGGYDSFNPYLFGSSVAMQGIYYTQLNNYDVALANVDQTMLKTKSQRQAEKFSNKYAYDGDEPQVFSPLYTQLEDKGVWFKPYVSTERVDLKSGPDVDNTMYGALVGGDSVIIPAGKWDMQYSAYVGYNGSHQAFEGNEVTQNGGVVGLTAAAYRGDFFSALTANVSFHGADIKTTKGDADLATLATGVASKTGYNWELADGKFIIQPSWLMSYTFVNPFDDYTINGVKIKNDSLNAIQLAPGLKFIGNTEKGWQPYVGAKMVWNIIDDTKVKANEVNLPETTTKAYVEYGLGLQKSVGERFTGFGQAMFRNGGRTGAAFTLGARWAVGSLASDASKDKNKDKDSDTDN